MIDHIHALPEGYSLQEYVVTGTLGFGGFGITYSAHDTNLDMQVAIKEYLPSELAVRLEGSTVSAKSQQDRESFDWGLERFIDEGRAVARFNHPNIIRIHRFFEQNGTGYIVMELIEGNTLAEHLEQQRTLTESQLRAWLWPILDGLKVVHASGYIHRDIKPQNIMMNPDGVPILLDFGAARLAVGGRTQSMTSIMTPGFAPLEQYQTRGQGPWTDVYALGAVMYKCIAGKKPQDALDRVTDDQLEPADSQTAHVYSPGLLTGILAALTISASDRPQSIVAWLSILEGQASEPEDNATRIMAPGQRASVPSDSNPSDSSAETTDVVHSRVAERDDKAGQQSSIAGWIGVAGLVLVIGGTAAFWQFSRHDEVTEQASVPAESGAVEQTANQAGSTELMESTGLVGSSGLVDSSDTTDSSGITGSSGGTTSTSPSVANSSASLNALQVPVLHIPDSGAAKVVETGSQKQTEMGSSLREPASGLSTAPELPVSQPQSTTQLVVSETTERSSNSSSSVLAAGDEIQDCEKCPVLVVIPAGQFTMGSPLSEAGRTSGEAESRPANVETPFGMGKFEVTTAEFIRFVGDSGQETKADLSGAPDQPVSGVTWNEANGYTAWLSVQTGQNYRLPTEQEWEYAARAGSISAYWWGDAVGSGNAHCKGCNSTANTQFPAMAGSFPANPFGLHEVHGNVAEWVFDCSNTAASSSSNCNLRVLRGGSFVDQAPGVRSAFRYVMNPRQSRNYLGFRVARDL